MPPLLKTFNALVAEPLPLRLEEQPHRVWSPSRSEQLLREIGVKLVRNEAGNVVSWPASEPLRPGCSVVKPTGVDEPLGVYEGREYSKRDAIHHEVANNAHEVQLLPYASGRVLFDGDDVGAEMFDDRALNTPTGLRNLSANQLLIQGLKP